MALIPFISAATIICSCFNARRSFNTRNNLIKRRIIIMLPLPVGKNEPITTIKSNYYVRMAGRGGEIHEKRFRKIYKAIQQKVREIREEINTIPISYLIPIIIKIFERLQLKARHFQTQFEDKHPLDNSVNKV